MTRFYETTGDRFVLFRNRAVPSWRPSQSGALGALLGHWAVHHRKPALIAAPTGSGKTGIALAAPYIVEATRTLVVVPSTQLRRQMASAFETQALMRQVGAVAGDESPNVLEVTGRLESWEGCKDADVVVALPQSISPEHYGGANKPSPDLFDLIIVDEAHHVPARTWRAIVDHFDNARKVLLTATPRRRDGKLVPGETIFHYPLRAALADGSYKEVDARLLSAADSTQRGESDIIIRDEIVRELNRPEHASSTLLVRAESKSRVADLVSLYDKTGIDVAPLTSDLSDRRRAQLIEGLKNGRIRAVAVVGMLGEGFDLPSLRLVAYHDKHKSVASTVQLIGRLVRSHPGFPQSSVLVTVRDADAYRGLQIAVRELYQEDADWSSLLPGIVDDAIQEDRDEKVFSGELATPPMQLALEELRPLVRATVYEVSDGWEPPFVDGTIPACLSRGQQVRGKEILYATLTPDNRTLLVVTQGKRSPRWNLGSGLDSPEYALHLITFLPSTETVRSPLLLVNSSDATVVPTLGAALGMSVEHLRPAAPERLHRAFDVLPRTSVSNIGVRNTYGGGRGSASYKMFAGSGVDRGMREADTAQSAIGHAMAQVTNSPGANPFHIGFSVGKAKMWESRYVPLRDYDGIMMDFAHRYWSSSEVMAPLLPSVARGVRLDVFPNCDVVTIEMHPLLLGAGWTTLDGFPVDRLDFRCEPESVAPYYLDFTAVRPDTGAPVWSGQLNTLGSVSDGSSSVPVLRGYGGRRTLADLLASKPPTVHFLNGDSVSGSTLYRSPTVQRDLSRWSPTPFDWTSTNITKETDRSAQAAGAGDSILKTLRSHLVSQPTAARKRWVLENDGPGELADLIVLELLGRTEISIELWHAKAAGGAGPSVRVSDMQVVVAQAIKSRRWLTDHGVWKQMSERYVGRVPPNLLLVDGDRKLLEVLLGNNSNHPSWSLMNRPMQLRGKVVIAQPGLSWSQLKAKVVENDLAATQVRDLLAVFDDALGALGESEIVCST